MSDTDVQETQVESLADLAAEQPPAPEIEAAPAREISAASPAWAVGRRKSSSARVRIFPGSGQFTINGRPVNEYFVHAVDLRAAHAPLDVLELRDTLDVHVRVQGGGPTGQAGAVRHGLARAIAGAYPEHELKMREARFMTRDARLKERKKYGRRGARRGFQFSKR